MGDYYGYTWEPGSIRVAEHDTYVPEGRTHLQRATDFTDTDKVAHIRVLWPMIQGLDATKIADLAKSWRKLSTQLSTAKDGLSGAGGRLAPQWTGKASRAFLERVGGSLYSLDQWVEAASTNAATIGRLADDVRTTQPKVERIYRDWLTESAKEKAKRNKDAGELSAQDMNDFIGFLSKNNSITDGGYLYRWARDSVPQDEIDAKYTALALPLVKKLADHFSSAATTGISLPGKFKGPTTFKSVRPTFGGAPGLPPVQPPAPAIPVVAPPTVGVPPVGAPGLPPALPGRPGVRPPGAPSLSGVRAPGAPALPAGFPAAPGAPSVARPVTARSGLPAAPTQPGLPALPGRTAARTARPAVPPGPGQGRRGAAKPAAPALPGRTSGKPGGPNAARNTRGTNGRPTVPPAAGPRLGGRATPQSRSGTVVPPKAAPTRLPGRVGEPQNPMPTPGSVPPEFRRATPSAPVPVTDAPDFAPHPPAPPSLGGRRRSTPFAAPVPPPTSTPELTGRAAPHGIQPPDTRPAVDARRTGPDPVTAPEESFAPAESAPPVIERPTAPTAQPAGPALGRS
ncbi:hypothetical protein [Cryptosporangium sp. NPDC048952]|uniref:WXG100 family type VII secretion target n=1 Tax=Cryptosporangium sp. NPDC048952 TaxID=3363961 RepID=UPI00371DABC5